MLSESTECTVNHTVAKTTGGFNFTASFYTGFAGIYYCIYTCITLSSPLKMGSMVEFAKSTVAIPSTYFQTQHASTYTVQFTVHVYNVI